MILWFLVPKKLPFTAIIVSQAYPLSASTVTAKKFDCNDEWLLNKKKK